MGFAHHLITVFQGINTMAYYNQHLILEGKEKMNYPCTINCSTSILFLLQTGTYIGGYLTF